MEYLRFAEETDDDLADIGGSSLDEPSASSTTQPPHGKPPSWVPYEDYGNSEQQLQQRNRKPSLRVRLATLRWQLLTFCNRPRFGTRWAVGNVLLGILCIGMLALSGSRFKEDEPGETGAIPQAAMVVAFILIMRNSVQQVFFALSLERAIHWHIYVSYVAIITAIIHGFHAMKRTGNYSLGDFTNLSGWLATICLFLLYLTSFGAVRRRIFDFFMRMHWLLFLLAAFLAVAHGAGGVGAGLALWGLDLFYREYREFFCLPRQAALRVMPGDVLCLSFPKGSLTFRPGQYLFVCVPEITRLEYHPFSISSSPHSDVVTLHIRALGDWTRRLLELARTKTYLNLLLDGPVGEINLDVYGPTYEHFILISGGIGITPMQSVCNMLIEQQRRGRPLKKVLFVWAARDVGILDSMIGSGNLKPLQGPTAAMFVPDLLSEHVCSSLHPTHEFHAAGHFLHTAFHLTQSSETTRKVIRAAGAAENDDGGSSSPGTNVNIASRSSSSNLLTVSDSSSLLPLGDDGSALSDVRIPVTSNSNNSNGNEDDSEFYDDPNSPPLHRQLIQFGRPDLRDYFQRMAAIAGPTAPVAVLACGPRALTNDVVQLARAHPNFHVHIESFAL